MSLLVSLEPVLCLLGVRLFLLLLVAILLIRLACLRATLFFPSGRRCVATSFCACIITFDVGCRLLVQDL